MCVDHKNRLIHIWPGYWLHRTCMLHFTWLYRFTYLSVHVKIGESLPIFSFNMMSQRHSVERSKLIQQLWHNHLSFSSFSFHPLSINMRIYIYIHSQIYIFIDSRSWYDWSHSVDLYRLLSFMVVFKLYFFKKKSFITYENYFIICLWKLSFFFLYSSNLFFFIQFEALYRRKTITTD